MTRDTFEAYISNTRHSRSIRTPGHPYLTGPPAITIDTQTRSHLADGGS